MTVSRSKTAKLHLATPRGVGWGGGGWNGDQRANSQTGNGEELIQDFFTDSRTYVEIEHTTFFFNSVNQHFCLELNITLFAILRPYTQTRSMIWNFTNEGICILIFKPSGSNFHLERICSLIGPFTPIFTNLANGAEGSLLTLHAANWI